MKNVLLLLALQGILGTGYSQLRLALTGGFHSANIRESNSIPDSESQVKPGFTNRPGMHLGVLSDIPLGGRLSLQPGLQYIAKGRRFSMRYDTATAMISDTLFARNNFNVNYIELPVLATLRFPLGKTTRFLLSAGPYAGFFYGGKSVQETRFFVSNTYLMEEKPVEAGREEGKVQTFDAGLQARAGFEFGNIFLSAFLSRGLINFYRADYSGTFHHEVRGLSLGIWLNKVQKSAPLVRDRDADGVPDAEDICPDLAGTPAARGCPDRDGDGVPDKDDSCPDQAGLAGLSGCPDRDNDDIADRDDLCPDIPGLRDRRGCPLMDQDGDGVPDEADQCPMKAGPASNNGCPLPPADTLIRQQQEKLRFVAQHIQFEPSSDKLLPSSVGYLEEVARMLDRHPGHKLSIEGHTDSTGREEANLQLSLQRAAAVRDQLMRFGVAAERMRTNGFGSSRPIDSNATPEGRRRNRRVELHLLSE